MVNVNISISGSWKYISALYMKNAGVHFMHSEYKKYKNLGYLYGTADYSQWVGII